MEGKSLKSVTVPFAWCEWMRGEAAEVGHWGAGEKRYKTVGESCREVSTKKRKK
jgi:hypothetical protein